MRTKTMAPQIQTVDDLPKRTRKALEEYMTVTPEIGRAKGAEDLVLVTTQSGSTYLVDIAEGSCECPDSQHRHPEGGCKHFRRARFATGYQPIPAAAAEQCKVDTDLGACTNANLRFAAADGGVIESRG